MGWTIILSIIGLIGPVILALIGGALLRLVLDIFKAGKISYWTCFLLALICTAADGLFLWMAGTISFALIILIALAVSLVIIVPFVNSKLQTGWGKSTLIWLVWIIFYFIVAVLCSTIITSLAETVGKVSGVFD